MVDDWGKNDVGGNERLDGSTKVEAFGSIQLELRCGLQLVSSVWQVVPVMPQPESQTCDNYRVPLSGIQFPKTLPKDLQAIIDNHHPFEFTIDRYK